MRTHDEHRVPWRTRPVEFGDAVGSEAPEPRRIGPALDVEERLVGLRADSQNVCA